MSGTYAGFSGTGRLTRDAELKYLTSGQAVCHFSIVTDRRTKKGEAWVDEPSFWDVDIWGKSGESLNQYLTKGKLVHIVGQLYTEQWEKDGQKHQKVKISATQVILLPSGSKESKPEAPNSQAFVDDSPVPF